MPTIDERWDELPILERTEIAKAAGLEGKIGSSTWEKLHDGDKDALMEWARPNRSFAAESALDVSSITTQDDVDKVASKMLDQASSSPDYEHFSRAIDWDEGKITETQDYLLWVGYASYPTIRSFVEEAETVGVSKRISRLPKDLKLTKSKVFLAHDEGETGDAVIFGYFIPEGVEVIVHRKGRDGIPKELEGIAKAVTIEQAAEEPDRGCGRREDIKAIYLVSGELTIIKPYKDYNITIDPKARRFRGIKKVNGDAILSGRSKRAPSVIHRVKRSERIASKDGSDWNDLERETLRGLVERLGPWRAFKEMKKISGRSINGAAFQYAKMKKEGQ